VLRCWTAFIMYLGAYESRSLDELALMLGAAGAAAAAAAAAAEC
jgi:hypothetical protein